MKTYNYPTKIKFEKGIEEREARIIAKRVIGTANYNPRIERHRECGSFGFLRGVEEFNGMTSSEALDTIKDYVVWAMEQGLAEEERVSDAIKRLQLLIEEAK